MEPGAKKLPLVIEPEDLEAILGHPDLLILDLSQASTYSRAHVPGAIHLPYNQLLAGTPPAPGKLPSREHLIEVFSGIGLTADKTVITYDDEGGGWAGRLIWTLDVIGHPHYAYLNGGIHAWLAGKHPVQTEPVLPTPTRCEFELDLTPSVTMAYILEHLESDNIAIWDARGPDEYAGTKVLAQRGGHIPGAECYEWTRAMDQNNNLRIRNHESLIKELATLGITRDKEIITHCQTHHRSGFTYLVGKLLGFKNIRAYPGSWAEWGNSPNTPVETN